MARCGWCIGGDHANCVVVVEMGESDKGKKSGPRVGRTQGGKYLWHCACLCSKLTVCLDCHRRGVEVRDYRCKDREDCERFRTEAGPFTRPKPPERG